MKASALGLTLGVAALVTGPVSAANAAATTTGSVTIAVPASVLASGASNGFIALTTSPAGSTFDTTSCVLDVKFPVTGGDADLGSLSGTLQTGGALTVYNVRNGKSVKFTNLVYDVRFGDVTAQPNGGAAIDVFDLQPEVDFDQTDTTSTITAQGLTLDAAASSYLDTKLGTKYFVADRSIGSFNATWTPASTS